MCDQISPLHADKYMLLKNFVEVEKCKLLTAELFELVAKQPVNKDVQCPKSDAVYGAEAFNKLLVDTLPRMEHLTGKKLLPTYSYARLYKHGEELAIHVDRPACEISATITLGFDSECWPIYMGDDGGINASKIEMDVGDAVLYLGIDKHHWRNKFEGQWQAQVFLHYVDANGPHAEWEWDKKRPVKAEKPEMLHWFFTDIFTEQDCDLIVKAYSDELLKKEPPFIGGNSGTIDLSIRNVQRVIIPIYKDLGAQLAAAGLSANNQAWKFDITHANQAEFLIYPAGGLYTSHVDTFMYPNEECRKLTVLAFLNDDFKGGKFYIQNGHDKYYPPQSKGTVLVFPSFFLHGVEPVEEGTRYSAVCWMVGKFFK
jgi:hypothetical protein